MGAVGALRPAAHRPSWGFSLAASCALPVVSRCLRPPCRLCPRATTKLRSLGSDIALDLESHVGRWNFTHPRSVFLLAGEKERTPNAKIYEKETRLPLRCSIIVHFPPIFCGLDSSTGSELICFCSPPTSSTLHVST